MAEADVLGPEGVPPVVVLDANVLFPAQLRDLLMRLAVMGLLRVHWSDRIHKEWMGAVRARHPDVTAEQLGRTRHLMEQALPGANVDRYGEAAPAPRGLVGLPDPNDEHVVETALRSEASFIVTENIRDFPPPLLDACGLVALRPDDLLLRLLRTDATGVTRVLTAHRATLRRPPLSEADYLRSLAASGLDKFTRAFRALNVRI